jgi:hypothetical protein
MHPSTSNIVVKKYRQHTQPFIDNLQSKIQTMKEEMNEYDYMFAAHETGIEWYECLERVYDMYIQPNLANENDTPSKYIVRHVLIFSLMTICRHNSSFFDF